MECPSCHQQGNLLKRVFVRRSGQPNRYCVYCGAEVKLVYHWKKIFRMIFLVVAVIFVIHVLMIYYGLPGLSSGIAGGVVAAVSAIFIRRPGYTEVQLIRKKRRKR